MAVGTSDDRGGGGVLAGSAARPAQRRRARRLALLLSGDREHVDLAAPPDQLVQQRAAQQVAPRGSLGLADDDAGDVVRRARRRGSRRPRSCR